MSKLKIAWKFIDLYNQFVTFSNSKSNVVLPAVLVSPQFGDCLLGTATIPLRDAVAFGRGGAHEQWVRFQDSSGQFSGEVRG